MSSSLVRISGVSYRVIPLAGRWSLSACLSMWRISLYTRSKVARSPWRTSAYHLSHPKKVRHISWQ